MNKEKAFKNLKDVAKILDGHDIHYWAEAGTCLGIHRENDFIDHDMDIDIGILYEDCRNLDDLLALFGSFLANGFRIYHTFGTLNDGYEIALWRDGIKLDIFWFYKNGEKREHCAWLNGGRNGLSDKLVYQYDAYLVESHKIVDFKGTKIRIPKHTEKYLETKYGKDWQVPNKNWNWATSPKNRVVNN